MENRDEITARDPNVFRHDPALALWERRDGGWAGGAAAWRGQDRVLAWPAVAQWRGRIAVPAAGGAPASDAARLVRLAGAIVAALGAPARLEDVVTLAADALGGGRRSGDARRHGVREVAPRAPEVEPGPVADAPLAERQFLERAWTAIRALPVRQRAALLLNLSGPSSQDMLSLLPATGLASWREIAATLDMEEGRLDALVPALPLDDRTIGALLAVSRRQVIDLRTRARERLARRLGLTRGARAGGRW